MILPGTRSPKLKIQARNESMLRWLVQRLLCQIECGARGDLVRISRMGAVLQLRSHFPE